MQKEEVITLRNTLKTVENFPLRVFIDNGNTIVDESLKTQFTKWDDNNGILYSFRLIGMQEDSAPNNREQAISLIAIDYDTIQAMEISRLPIGKIAACIDGLNKSGAGIGDEFKNLIVSTFTKLLTTDRSSLSPSDMNRIISSSTLQSDAPDAVNEKDDYYAGKFTESRQETLAVNRYNASINSSTETKNS
jgi:hypothetical protein